jgi:hypothetical protein
MLSKIKSVRGGTGFVVGLLVAMLVVPSVAVAATLRFTGIEGTNGTTSTLNKAGVTSANQLETSSAGPSSAYSLEAAVDFLNDSWVVVAQPPSGDALMVTSIHVDTFYDPTTGPTEQPEPTLDLALFTGSCSGFIGFTDAISPSTNGETVLPYDPGLPIPAGDSLCGFASNLQVSTTAVGYSVPSGSVPAAAVRHTSTISPTRVPFAAKG